MKQYVQIAKRIMAVALSVAMLISLLPANLLTAYADIEETTQGIGENSIDKYDTGIILDFVDEGIDPEGVSIGYPTATITSTNLNVYANHTYGSVGVNVGDASGEEIEILLSFEFPNSQVIYQYAYRGTTNAELKEAAVDFYFISANDVKLEGEGPTDEEVQEVYDQLLTITTWEDWEEYVSSLDEDMKSALLELPEEQVNTILALDEKFAKEKEEAFAPPAVDFVEVAPLVFRAKAGETEISVAGTLPVDGELSVVELDVEELDTDDFDIVAEENLVGGYDISVLYDDEAWQPEEDETLTVTIDVASLGIPDGTILAVHHKHNDIVTTTTHTVENGAIKVEISGFSDFWLELNPQTINKLGSFNKDSVNLYYNFFLSDEVYTLTSDNIPENFVVEYSFTYGTETWYMINTEAWLSVDTSEVYPAYVKAEDIILSDILAVTDDQTNVSVSGAIPEGTSLSVTSETMSNAGVTATEYPVSDNSIFYDVKFIDESNTEVQPTGDITVVFPAVSVPFAEGTKYFTFHIHEGNVELLDSAEYAGGSISVKVNQLSYLGAAEINATESLGDLIDEDTTIISNPYFEVGEELTATINKTPVTVYENSLEVAAGGVVVTDAVGEEVTLVQKVTFSNGVVLYRYEYYGTHEVLDAIVASYGFISEEDINIAGTVPTEAEVTEAYNKLISITTWEDWEEYVSTLSVEMKNAILALSTDKVEEIERLDNLYYKEKLIEFAPPAVDYTQAAPLVGNMITETPVSYMEDVPALMSTLAETPALMSLTRDIPAVMSVTPNNGLELSKTSTGPDKDGYYTVKLEAFTTGTVTAGEATPSDIILVLDLSTSMKEQFSSSGYTYKEAYPNTSTSGTYYLKNGQGVTYCDNCNSWAYGCRDRLLGHQKGTLVSPKTSADDKDANHVQFYTRTTVAAMTRLEALKSAMTSFVGTVADQASADRIAIVGFHTNGVRLTGSSNATAFVDATSGEDSLKAIISSIDNSDLKGATEHGTGMELADTIFDAQTTTDYTNRNKVVVMVTEGEPAPLGTGSWSSRTVKQAIEKSYELKNSHNATVYTISVMPGTDASNPTTPMDKFMDYMSSNYLNARYTADDMDNRTSSGYSYYSGDEENIINAIVPGTKVSTTGSYYLTAGNLDALSSIFGNIAAQTGGAKLTLDATTQIKDIVSPYFELPSGADTSKISVTTQDAIYTEGILDWTTSTIQNFNPTVTINNKDVVVSGFDFTHNFVAETGRTEGDVTQAGEFHGRKLIIEFKVKPENDFLGGNNVPTNNINSGVYNSAGEEIEKFSCPTVNVAVKEVVPETVDQNVYITNNADLKELFTGSHVESSGKDAVLVANGVNNAYVTLTYTIKDSKGNTIGTYFLDKGVPFRNEDGAFAGDWTPNGSYTLTPELLEDETYKIVCTADGTNGGTANTATTDPAVTANVYVFKPTVTFKDSTGWLGDNVPTLTDTENYLSAKTVWKHGDTLSTNVTMSDTAPTITNEYTIIGTGVEDGIIVTTDDIPVNVESMANGTDITQYTIYEHQDCSGKTCTLTGDAEMLIHVNTVSLDITKNVQDTNGKAVESEEKFHVTIFYSGKAFTELLEVLEVLNGSTGTGVEMNVSNGSATINLELADGDVVKLTKLPVGTYVATETVDSNRYDTTVQVDATAAATGALAETTLSSTKESSTIAFVNILKTGSLTISKTVVMPIGFAHTGEKFAFEVRQGNNVVATFSIANGGSHTVDNLVQGNYTVVEVMTDAQKALYTADKETQTVTVIAGAEATASVTNTAKKGSLEVSKNVVDEAVNYDSTNDTFKVKVKVDGYTGSDITYTIGDTATTATIGTDGYATITLANGQSALFENLLANVNYNVTEVLTTEQEAVYKTPVVTNATSTIGAGSTKEVTITNTVKTGTLVIDKEIKLPQGVSVADDETFAFTVTGPNGYKNENVSIAKDGQTEIINLLVGEYTVVENLDTDQQKIYTTSYSTEGGKTTVVDGKTTTVTVTNTVTAGKLDVTKTVVDVDKNINSTDKYTMKIALTGDIIVEKLIGTIAGTATEVPVTNGIATIELANGEIAQFTNIPVGVTYKVTETDVDTSYYKVSYNNETGTITTDTPLVTVTNTRNYGKLTITKKIQDANGNNIVANAGETFVFNVTKTDGTTMKVVIAGTGSVTLTNLPMGTYTIEEDQSWSYKYTAKYTSVEVTITETADAYAEIINVPKKDKWLKADAYAENVFSAVAAGSVTIE